MEMIDRLLEMPLIYRVWQAPFAAEKFAPVARALAGAVPGRVLDVGCGPGTNAAFFTGSEYVGLDINDRYLEIARRRYRGTFVQADLATADLESLGTFDAVLVNSFLHHLPDASMDRILAQVSRLLAPTGSVHILELVRPPQWNIARLMAALDRGDYARPVNEWRRAFERHFAADAMESYMLGGCLWSMTYFRGRRR